MQDHGLSEKQKKERPNDGKTRFKRPYMPAQALSETLDVRNSSFVLDRCITSQKLRETFFFVSRNPARVSQADFR